MRALSLTQPWATLVAIGAKRLETRSWSTEYRGPLAIHASKAFPRECRALVSQEPFRSVLARFGYLPDESGVAGQLPRGCVLAVGELTECMGTAGERTFSPEKPSAANWTSAAVFGWQACLNLISGVGEHELAFGDFSPGRFAWKLERVEQFVRPVLARGKLGLWTWDREAERAS